MNGNPIVRNSTGIRQADISSGQRTAGSTLTEVLITLVILSIGILTAARMLNDSLQLLGDSVYRQRAIRLAADLAELLGNTHASMVSGAPTPADHDCEHNICNPQQFLEHNLQYWHARATQLLPGGSVSIGLQTAGEHTLAQITVGWTLRGSTVASHFTQTMLLPDP